ncbi:MAG: FkbM family methyltransferase [Candidatus Contendobacter sp.]|nr:FkbM family methyltransferase [Candidatus Contendobacter sp.]
MGILNTLFFILNHPLNKSQKMKAVSRYLSWQIGSRILPSSVVVPFVDSTRLLVSPGMTGATGNIYCGLHEFEDMAFVLHALRKGDLFLDIGANIGSYTILASGAVGCESMTFEPVPSTFTHLLDNIKLNSLESLVHALNLALGSEDGQINFTSNLDTVNHVLAPDERNNSSITVKMNRLDDVVGEREPTLIKIDVEGFETEVLKGANKTLEKDSLLAVLMELNGSGNRYGYDEEALHLFMVNMGFELFSYWPFERKLSSASQPAQNCSGNKLYAKSPDVLQKRLLSARKYQVLGISL